MKTKKEMSNVMKIVGISLLFLIVPGSSFLLPIIFGKKLYDKKKSNESLGI
jgi:hypothetical protein